jgi:hypothetical protein
MALPYPTKASCQQELLNVTPKRSWVPRNFGFQLIAPIDIPSWVNNCLADVEQQKACLAVRAAGCRR